MKNPVVFGVLALFILGMLLDDSVQAVRWSSFKLLSQDPDRTQRQGRQGTAPPARPRLYYNPGMAWGKRGGPIDYYPYDSDER